ncbi:MFS transporter [Corynebacterium kalidii]|uniref:MFS transporter n=1 Tax=Corynebacterium kalidii TaxID=2931982 RepID=A0A9X1WPX6_9CORY|nr:MFS transporter [Corynebacterium kalidii]MCJ7859096.1 MFS transporter [Corynebacterium kalidii]
MSTTPTTTDRQARRAVAALFLTNGAVLANLVPRYPEIKDDLGMSNAVYGLAVIAFPVGAIIAGLGAAPLIRRFGSAPVAVAGTVGTALGVLGAGASPTLLLFVAALFLGGAMDAVTDVAQNDHGLRVQRRYGRTIINSFHAVWSLGAVLGGAMAAAAIAVDLPLPVHLGISAAVFSLVAVTASRYCLPVSDDGPGAAPTVAEDAAATPATSAASGAPAASGHSRRAPLSGRVVAVLAALVVIAVAGSLVEDAGMSWASLYITSLGAPGSVAATGFVALVAAQFVGRILGDGMVDRMGQRTVARLGGTVAAVGMGLALAFPTVPGTVVGFAAAGFGVATLIPAAMQAASELPGLRPGTGLTVVSWVMRIGFLCSPPLVGMVADATSLRVGLLVIPLAGVATVVLAGVLHGRRTAA